MGRFISPVLKSSRLKRRAGNRIGFAPSSPYPFDFAGSAALLLDSITATAAYSFRQLRTAYAGDCLRVRRSSDNAEDDIAFVGGVIDTASLLSFCGSGSGYVVTWYDQVGSADFTQADTSKQPRIVNSGVIDLIGTEAAMTTGTQYLDAALTIGGTELTAVCVAQLATGAVQWARLLSASKNAEADHDSTSRAAIFLRNLNTSAVAAYSGGGVLSSVGITMDEGFIGVSRFTGAAHRMWIDGSAGSSVSVSNVFDVNKVRVGASLEASPSFWSGSAAEVILLADAISDSDRIRIQSDLSSYYGIDINVG